MLAGRPPVNLKHVGLYDRMRAQVARGDHVDVTLSANFRSVPLLVAWANARFADILGTSPDRSPG